MNKPTVSVVMITYGHENFIEEAINGVLMQQCNFDVELIIADDESPDDTEKVIKTIIKNHSKGHWIKYTKHITNKGMQENFVWALNQCTGKYIAICEGDDYWTVPFKLQKQFDFLEKNENHGLISTQRSNFNEITKELTTPSFNNNQTYNSFDFSDVLLGKVQLATLTTFFRKELIDEFLRINEINKGKLSCLDYCLWMFFSYNMKVAVLNINTAVYRILPNSASHGSSKKIWDLKKKYYHDFNFYKFFFTDADENLFESAEYKRVKSYYILALKAEDYESCYDLNLVFLKNKDYLRYYMIRAVIFSKKLIWIPICFEKAVKRI